MEKKADGFSRETITYTTDQLPVMVGINRRGDEVCAVWS
jgi:hypothetical protein